MDWQLKIENHRYVLRPGTLPRYLELGFLGRHLSEPLRPPERTRHQVTLEQVHGARVQRVNRPGVVSACDGVHTGVPDLELMVKTADCLPVAMAGAGEVVMVHAGWRGLVAGVLEAGVDAFRKRGPLRVWIGPGIGACCFEVGPEVAVQFPDPSVRTLASGRTHIDLAGVAVSRLVAAGVPPGSIDSCPLCTKCNQHVLYSHRGSRGAPQRIIALIRLLSSGQAHPQES